LYVIEVTAAAEELPVLRVCTFTAERHDDRTEDTRRRRWRVKTVACEEETTTVAMGRTIVLRNKNILFY
jgi:hypothetical protein